MKTIKTNDFGIDFIDDDITLIKFPKPRPTKKICPKKYNVPRYKVGEKIKERMNEKKTKDVKLLHDIKKSLINEMQEKLGYAICQECSRSGLRLELHHIIFRSEIPSHPKKHSKINSLLLCRECHEAFHREKCLRNKWIIERELWKIFECIKKERFDK